MSRSPLKLSSVKDLSHSDVDKLFDEDAGERPLWGLCTQGETGTVKTQSPRWTLNHLDQHVQKIQIWSFVSKWKRHFFLTLKKWVHNIMGILWLTVRGTTDRVLLEKPGFVENDTLYSLLPYYLTFSTLHSSAKGWQSQQLPPWVRTSSFKEHLVFRSVATK